jgi:hypothetical protein
MCIGCGSLGSSSIRFAFVSELVFVCLARKLYLFNVVMVLCVLFSSLARVSVNGLRHQTALKARVG